MRKIVLSGAVIGILLVVISLLAKVNHWIGASKLLNFGIAGFVLLLVCGGILIALAIKGAKQ